MDIDSKTIVGVIEEAITSVIIIVAMAIVEVIKEARPISMVE
jgi:hypothetical protein